MTLISEFFDVKIFFNFNGLLPPHFQAFFEEKIALIDIEQGYVIEGNLPDKQLKLVLAWCEIHREELLGEWEIIKHHGAPYKIDPLK